MSRILWSPTSKRAEASTMAAFERFIADTRGLTFSDYNAMWEWSVTDLEAFWDAIWDFFDVRASVPPSRILAKRTMPGAEWCPDAMLNYADNILRHAEGREDHPALVSVSETSGRIELTWGELRRQVASLAAHLKRMGVEQGDRVVAVLPNTEAALIALLATSSIGAAWSLCAPDMGHVAIVDRFKQIAPKVFISQDGYVHAGKTVDRREVLAQIASELPSVAHACCTTMLRLKQRRFPSTSRCGSSIPPAPQAIPSLLFTAMAV